MQQAARTPAHLAHPHRYWGLERGLAIGVALVSCMPGGTASNIIAYIARVGARAHVLQASCSPHSAWLQCCACSPTGCAPSPGLHHLDCSLPCTTTPSFGVRPLPCFARGAGGDGVDKPHASLSSPLHVQCDMPLSVMMTSASTLMAIAATPLLSSLLVSLSYSPRTQPCLLIWFGLI